jgi:hypothetical protein
MTDQPTPAGELDQAANDLEALHTAAYGTIWRIAREEEDAYSENRAIGIEPADGDADIVVFQADDIAEEDAAYIAAMGPNIAQHLVQLLRDEAVRNRMDVQTAATQFALSIARLINSRPR